MLATATGLLVFWTIPLYLSDMLPVTLPVAFFEGQAALVTFGSLACNWATAAFLR
jgi:hypothetical protein